MKSHGIISSSDFSCESTCSPNRPVASHAAPATAARLQRSVAAANTDGINLYPVEITSVVGVRMRCTIHTQLDHITVCVFDVAITTIDIAASAVRLLQNGHWSSWLLAAVDATPRTIDAYRRWMILAKLHRKDDNPRDDCRRRGCR